MINYRVISTVNFPFPKMKKLLNEVIIVIEGKNKEYYDMSEELFKLISFQPYSAGRFLGHYKHGMLIPSFELMQEYVDRFDDDYITINSKAEQLFIYGRDIFESSIVSKKGKGPLFIVCNKNKEVIGLAKESEKIFKNLTDIGLFLRKYA